MKKSPWRLTYREVTAPIYASGASEHATTVMDCLSEIGCELKLKEDKSGSSVIAELLLEAEDWQIRKFGTSAKWAYRRLKSVLAPLSEDTGWTFEIILTSDECTLVLSVQNGKMTCKGKFENQLEALLSSVA